MGQPRALRNERLGAVSVVAAMGTESFVLSTYLVETALPLRHTIEVLAGEQSTGTFVKIAGESDDLRAKYRATVESITELEPWDYTPLDGSIGAGGGDDFSTRTRAMVTLRFPLHNFGANIPNLLAAVAGNLFEIKELCSIKLMDLELPAEFAEAYPGPAFGVTGTRELMGRTEGAMIGTIIKPSIGLSTDQLAELVGELAGAGVDFIKDDELQGNSPASPLAERVKAVMPVLKRSADKTGVMPMYAFNITDDVANLERNHDLVVEAGGTCVMVCLNMMGLPAAHFIRQHAQVPIHGHRAMFGAMNRSAQVGIAFRAWQKLARLVGSDHLHTNGISNKFYESDAQVLDSIAAVQEPLLGQVPTVPVLSSGQWAGLAHATYREIQTTDVLMLAGGGIHGHPDGPRAGVQSMRDAWAGAAAGLPLAEVMAQSKPLRRAVEQFGPPRD